MNITQIEENTKQLVNKTISGEVALQDFVYELLLAYGHRPQSVGRLRSGERNLAKVEGEVLWKRHIYFKHSKTGSLHSDIDTMRKEKFVSKYKVRFVIATDFNEFLAVDTKTLEPLDIDFENLAKHFDFFLPWAQMEKAVYQGENPADVKAAEKMAKLFDLIKEENFDKDSKNDLQKLHNLNVFLTRLLFCFFAEDTGIFKDNQFSNAIGSHTLADGSDLSEYLNRLFTVLNTAERDRGDLPDYLAQFPYVNGGLFADDIPSPAFSARSRRILIECGSDLDWSNINPDIFGSMIQAVVHTDQRGSMGMHYTSVPNIMKVIEPLFLNSLYDELEEGQDNPRRLERLLQRLTSLKIFDPACGSGNFLIIAYKELRRLEMEVFKRLQELELERIDSSKGEMAQLRVPMSGIKLSQFYGIELDDFAHEVAILSLWLAEHQMNQEFKAEFGDCAPSLPLKRSGNIVADNAIRVDWSSFCPNAEGETYVAGNPPYIGQPNQKKEHVDDMNYCFNGEKDYKKLDYVSCWFFKAAKYINSKTKAAFVCTNSINQGMQVSMLWPKVYRHNVEIFFAHKDFKWSNNAKNKAQVTCSIIGLRQKNNEPKYIFINDIRTTCKNINAYLVDARDVIVSRTLKSISNLPKIVGGNQAREGGYLMLSDKEKIDLLESYPSSKKFIKRLMGTTEFIKGIRKWCLWIENSEVGEAMSIPPIAERIEKVRKLRESGNSVEINFKDYPHQFVMKKRPKESQILIPEVSSEKRKYIPISYIDSDTVITHKAQVLYDPEPYIFAIISSYLHMEWVRAVGGKLGTGFSYSVGLCYNTFPVPEIDDGQKLKLSESAMNIMLTREEFPDRNFQSLYDPKTMPDILKKAHEENDFLVESLYSKKPFATDIDRLSVLFGLYEKMNKDVEYA